jgi:hypothetical protein
MVRMPDQSESGRRVGSMKIKNSDVLVLREHEHACAVNGKRAFA